MTMRKKVRASSVFMTALGEPFSLNFFWMVGIPVALPSVKFNSFRKSPNRLFLYLRERKDLASFISSILIERSGFSCRSSMFIGNAMSL